MMVEQFEKAFNMKPTLVFALLFCIVAAYAYPTAELDDEDGHQQAHSRVRRVTCDVLSFEVQGSKLNDAACAGHCLFKGKRGGHCNGQSVCVCRS